MNAVCYVYDRSSEEYGRGKTPLGVLRIYRSNVPDNPIALATNLRARKLLLQFFCHQMILVPKLHGPWV